MSKIAFIGLGNMGGPMAVNLVKSNHDVTGFDLSKEAMLSFERAGGKTATTAIEACDGADVVVTMLPSGKHVAGLITAEFIDNLKPGTLIIESSTIDPTTARSVALLAEAHDCLMVDAPVSGGTVGAQNATLTFIVGGADQALERARPYLNCMGKNIFHAGPSGAGQMTKICNNLLLSILMIGTSEALNLGVANGLDPKVLSEIMQKSSGRNWALEIYNPYPGVMDGTPASREYVGGFAVDLMAKDLGLAIEAGLQTHTTTPLGSTAFDLYKMWSEAGSGRLDFSSIIRFLNQKELQLS
ncbi:MAG: 3-hydroxyisobutyrate dehydrogenase [Candidatus Obscuribacterales bacterium]|nr:3-hydroxyisobutyrate dehydrogenase [Candidatus Obscuribacterales bacterium]